MCEPENLHLQIMLGIVYYMLRQQELGTHHHGGQTELMAKLTELGEKMAPGLNIQSLLNGVTINAQETVMNDKYQVGQAGAVGPVSKARENFFARAWDVQRSQIDLDVLVRELGEVRDKGRALVQGRNEYVAIAELHHAEHAGRRGDGPGVLSHLALAGDWALGIAIAIDARMVTEAFEAATGAEPRWPRPQAEDGHYPDSPIGAGTRDRYIVNQAGSVGPGSTAHHTSFGRTGGEPDIDRQALRGDLAILRVAMRKEATELAHDIAVGEIAAAEIAAAKGDDSNMLNHLAKTGHWALGIASAIGATLAAEVIKKALGI